MTANPVTFDNEPDFRPHTSHWGVFSARWRDGKLDLLSHPEDPDPNGIINNFPGALRHPARIARPMVRRGWLERGPGPDRQRGRDEFVPMEWDAILDLLGGELRRIRDTHGPGAVFGGSYGGPVPGASIMRRAKCTAFSTHQWAGTCAP
jgi:biotin/methionine sulfoxide reductase